MAGIASGRAGAAAKQKPYVKPALVAILAAALILVGVWYYLFVMPLPPPSPNTPPHGLSILASPTTGNNTTTFVFTAQVSDDEDPVTAVQVRWDWQNDSAWDTAWSTNKNATHVFAQPGNYTVRVEAQDTGSLTANASRVMRVSAVPPPQPPLRIGTVLSVTGALGAFGMSQEMAVNMAVEEINAAGGVLGRPVQVFHMDDQTTPSVASQDAMTLITTNGVVAILGATGSSMCAAVLSVAQTYGVFELAPSCTSPIFSNVSYTGGWFARTAPSDALQAAVAASYAHNNRTFDYSGVMAIYNAYGTLTASAYADNFTRAGGTITDGSPRFFNTGTFDFTTELHAVLDVTPAPEVVYVISYPPEGVTLMRDWWQGLGSNPGWASVRWLFSEGVFDQTAFINPLVSSGVNVSEFQGTSPAAYAGLEPPAYGAWAVRYQAKYGVAPTLFSANAYDATYLVALAAQAAGATTAAGIRLKLPAVANPGGTAVGPDGWAAARQELAMGHDINYEGASGSVNVDSHGDVSSAYIIWAVNSSNELYTLEIFNESYVTSLVPATVAPQVGTLEEVLSAADRPRSPASWVPASRRGSLTF